MPVLKVKKNGVWDSVGGVSGHTHEVSEITDFPSSLPANGGNADTLDGKHADEFALASDFESLDAKIGDKSVSEQITDAIGVMQTKVTGSGITSIVKKTQAEYDAMSYHDPNTLYVIEG